MTRPIDQAVADFGVDVGVNHPMSVRPSVTYISETGVSETELNAVKASSDIALAIGDWMKSIESQRSVSWDLFNRRSYQTTDNIFKQFAMCEKAIEYDDILSTMADVTERIALDNVNFEMYDEDQQDVWDQVAEEIDFDGKVKSVFRELYKFSNAFVGVLWDQAIITVRTKPDPAEIAPPPTEPGEAVDPFNPPLPVPIPEPVKKKGNRQRRKKFAVTVPSAMTVFDVTKVMPVGQLMFGQERFCYIADDEETKAFGQVLGGDFVDDLVLRLIESKYTPNQKERYICGQLGINPNNLWLFKKDAIVRFTDTRADYERWASPRLKATFEILDMKEHLRSSDRASLIGSTNFIVVIKKGTDKWPARARELENLGEQAKVVARMPILVGDHRLSVEIVTPSVDHTLDGGRWDVLDDRLLFRALETFSIQKGAGARGTAQTVAQVVARGLESRRDNIIWSFKKTLFKNIIEKNPTALTEMPNAHCNPRRITLDINADLITAILAIRDRGDISRRTTLEELGYNEDVEAMRRATEKARYDAHFSSIVPFASPQATPYGTPPGGGAPGGGAKPPGGGNGANTDNPRSNGAQGGRPRGAKKTAAAPTKGTAPRKAAGGGTQRADLDDEGADIYGEGIEEEDID